ncbi:MAG TPA: RpiB/LacA/LacB family sugar-phosphate isomerase [Candidatus Paceibacterota bacterium]
MIYLASDHAGFELKEQLKKYLEEELGQEVEDMGAFELNPDDDYPDFIIPAAQKVAQDPKNNRAIILGASGQGEALAANKVRGVRATVYYGGPIEIVQRSRSHNNTNVLSLGARYLSADEAKKAVKLWLETEFEGGRHERRVNKINEFEQ